MPQIFLGRVGEISDTELMYQTGYNSKNVKMKKCFALFLQI